MPENSSLNAILEPTDQNDVLTPMNDSPPDLDDPTPDLDDVNNVGDKTDRDVSTAMEQLMNELPGLNRVAELSTTIQTALADMQDMIAQDSQPDTEAYMFLTDIKERMVYINSLLSSLEKEILTTSDDLSQGMEQFEISWMSTEEEMDELDDLDFEETTEEEFEELTNENRKGFDRVRLFNRG